ncbi:MAG TPA: PQQ-dependent sugar dehydrogenase [Rhodothermales bacterium]|nr:PQQ-dependent sugar dehydrogenase [Rhodothermales bacterium]
MNAIAGTSTLRVAMMLGLALVLAPLGVHLSYGQEATTGGFEKTVLVEKVTDPVELAIAPDNRVFFIERGGAIRVYHPDTDTTSLVGFIPVNEQIEFGMLGITLDPNFEQNGWMYVFYSPDGPDDVNRLSRFTVVNNEIEPGSQVNVLDVPVQRVECCHNGGSLAFGPDGNLFLSTGDNSNPFASNGYSPIDGRPGRKAWDSRRGAGNTNDLRGKILRIHPEPDGSYTIPEGNLFPEGTPKTKPEIYVMGDRNPYRISVDQETGWLYWGEVGPDAGTPSDVRGPAGHDEFNQAKKPGNYGWPYFVGDNKPYRRWNFETDSPAGDWYDPKAPENDSPHNTGMKILPPAQSAFIWYPYGPSPEFPEVEVGGRTAMSGPIYHYDAATAASTALPASFDGDWIIYEWSRNWIKLAELDENGDLVKILSPFSDVHILRPMDMEVGDDGRLYVIEWGPDFWGNGRPEQRIVRLDYYPNANRPPVVRADVDVAAGARPMQVNYSADGTEAQSDDVGLTYAWDFNGDGQADSDQMSGTYTYTTPGVYTVHLTVTDERGLKGEKQFSVTVGNAAPQVAITWPVNGGFFDYGQPIHYSATVTDAEDATISPQAIMAQPYLGQDTHELALQTQYGPEGSFVVYPDGYKYMVDKVVPLEVSYTDHGVDGAPRVTGTQRIILQPRRKEAEFAGTRDGATRKDLNDPRSPIVQTVVDMTNGGFLSYAPVNLLNIQSITLRVQPEAGGTIELHQDAPDGKLLGEVQVPKVDSTAIKAALKKVDLSAQDQEMHSSDSDDDAPPGWLDLTVPVKDPGGPMALYLVFKGPADTPLMALDWLQFDGPGIAASAPRGGR